MCDYCAFSAFFFPGKWRCRKVFHDHDDDEDDDDNDDDENDDKEDKKVKKIFFFKCCGDVAQLVRAWDRHADDAGSIPRCGKGFFSQSPLSVQTLLLVSVHPCVQSHALTSVRTLKIL